MAVGVDGVIVVGICGVGNGVGAERRVQALNVSKTMAQKLQGLKSPPLARVVET
jgi:hypothetical protein